VYDIPVALCACLSHRFASDADTLQATRASALGDGWRHVLVVDYEQLTYFVLMNELGC
jgi:hypothetical protein